MIRKTELPGKRERGKPNRRFMDVVREDMIAGLMERTGRDGGE